MAEQRPNTTSIFHRDVVLVSLGACALVFINAFESMAVTTVMPLVSRELGGAALYALAFAGPLATGVIGMVAAGNFADRRGPVIPLYASVVCFITGLLIAGTATSMPILLAGRLIQGLGGGSLSVSLYVMVARVYPPTLHAKMFGAFAACWVIPSMVGPYIAGLVAQALSWHWVFLGVILLVIPAMLMVVPALRGQTVSRANAAPVPWSVARLLWAVLAAIAVLALNLSVEAPAYTGLIAAAALVAALIAFRPLVPRGTLTAARGLPSVILTKGFVAAAFFGAEVYLPYLLIERYHFPPSLAGLSLTGAAVAWASASQIQGRLGTRLPSPLAVRWGSVLLVVALAIVITTAALTFPAPVAIGAWILAGAGMGLMYPRMSVLTLQYSTAQTQGFNTSAMNIADSLGGALSLASTGLVFAAFAAAGASFVAVFVLTGVLAAAAVMMSPRVAAAGRNVTL
ncbi:MFS transporter [Pseudarthrobacter sp. J1738]|uniref:MFS transporter n=1 Tax=Pseudarthrobacter sp. J1738 TaxID=3420446 RepID=UPI003D2CB62E